MNRKARRFYEKNGMRSPWLNEWLPLVPHDELQARAYVADSDQLTDRLNDEIIDIVDGMINVYDDSCRAWRELDFGRVEACKKTYAELSARFLEAVDHYSTAFEQKRVAMSWLDEHGFPLVPTAPLSTNSAQKGPEGPCLKQGNLLTDEGGIRNA